jgi:murein DD-endopeptidase MepM/ murein hydrolase activator NlpD
MAEYQILLLPKENYYEWVAAAKEYAAHFGASPTHDPHEAARYMAPQQTVTVAGAPNGYPAQGDIRQWLRQHYAGVRVDYVPAATPSELKAALDKRLRGNLRYGLATGEFRLRWPTDYARIQQPFAANPELYRRWNLPGHEGLDIFAPHNSQIYACAAGTVVRVDNYRGDPAAQA